MNRNPRTGRERKTVAAMVHIYCQGQPGAQGALCVECQELLHYANARLDRCPYAEDKPTCARCPIHCYRPDMRSRVRAVMRYAGPRMLLRHPGLALLHLLDGMRRPTGDRAVTGKTAL